MDSPDPLDPKEGVCWNEQEEEEEEEEEKEEKEVNFSNNHTCKQNDNRQILWPLIFKMLTCTLGRGITSVKFFVVHLWA